MKLLSIVNGSTLRELFIDKEEYAHKDITCQSFFIFAVNKRFMHRLINCQISNQM